MAVTYKRTQVIKSDAKDENVVINTPFPGHIGNRIEKAKKKLGVMSLQDVVRLAVAQFLDKNGY